jgi:tRNA threonylcarbamoyladenosine biosynthesis protein TsaB
VPVLVLDTATDTVLVGLSDGVRMLAERLEAGSREVAGRVLLTVDSVLAEAGLAHEAVRGVIVGVGPGSFTGLRIGIATALGLAHGLGVPATGVSTLAALAAGAPGAVACVDARRGEVFVQEPDRAPRAIAAADLPRELLPGATVVGEGAVRYREALEAGGAEVPAPADPRHRLRVSSYSGLADFDGSPVRPLYLRAPDATPTGSAVGGPVG